jgi:hypothetical protein
MKVVVFGELHMFVSTLTVIMFCQKLIVIVGRQCTLQKSDSYVMGLLYHFLDLRLEVEMLMN